MYKVEHLKKVFIRTHDRTTCPDGWAYNESTPIGWYSNIYNSAFGWGIFELSDYDKQWLINEGVDFWKTGIVIYRVASDKGTSIVKFNLYTGTHAHIDNEHYENTDRVRFEKMTAYKKLVFDNEKFLS